MSNIIEQLYYGNLEPQEYRTSLNGELKSKLKQLTMKEDRLNEKLNDAENEELTDFINAYNEYLCISCADAFISGFRQGARFAYDAFVD